MGFSLESEMPKQMCFLCFHGFIYDNLKFPSVKSSRIFTSHGIQQDTNFKHEKSRVCKCSFFLFLQMHVFYRWEKSVPIDFPEKRAPTKKKHLRLVCQVSWNFTEENARKFIVSLLFVLMLT